MLYDVSDMSQCSQQNGHSGTFFFCVLCPKISTGREKLAPAGWHVFATLSEYLQILQSSYTVKVQFNVSLMSKEATPKRCLMCKIISASLSHLLLNQSKSINYGPFPGNNQNNSGEIPPHPSICVFLPIY